MVSDIKETYNISLLFKLTNLNNLSIKILKYMLDPIAIFLCKKKKSKSAAKELLLYLYL